MTKPLLLIEPNLNQVKVLENWLNDKGYTVVTAHNLDEAISKIRINPYLYCMCILDADFPRGISEGLYVCKELKKDEITKTVPLVLMTYRGRLEEIIDGLDAGADIFLLKPFDTDYFSERINLIIDDLESKKYMKGVIDLALLEFLISLKNDGNGYKYLVALSKGFNRAIWNKIIPIMGFMPLQVTLERTKETIKDRYSFVDRFNGFNGGITVENVKQCDEISVDLIAEGFKHFIYHFLDIITTLTGNIVADMRILNKWDNQLQKSEVHKDSSI